MTIDALKGQNGITSTTQTSAPKKSNKTEEKSTQLSEALAGKTKNNTLSENGKKELIKYYQDNGYTRSEAEKLFNSKADKLDKMSRKEAKAWCKDYMEKNGCSKKEAKEAFKQEHGYSVPLNGFQKIGRMFALLNSIGTVAIIADEASSGKLGVKKFVTGQGNNDAKYIAKE